MNTYNIFYDLRFIALLLHIIALLQIHLNQHICRHEY